MHQLDFKNIQLPLPSALGILFSASSADYREQKAVGEEKREGLMVMVEVGGRLHFNCEDV